MWETYLVLSALLLILTILPKIPSPHWIFRFPDFGKIQITYFTIITFALGFIIEKTDYFWYLQGLLLAMIIYHGITLIKYTPLYKVKKHPQTDQSSK